MSEQILDLAMKLTIAETKLDKYREKFQGLLEYRERLVQRNAQLQAQLSEAREQVAARDSQIEHMDITLAEARARKVGAQAESAALREAAQKVLTQHGPAELHSRFHENLRQLEAALATPGPGAAFLERFRAMEAELAKLRGYIRRMEREYRVLIPQGIGTHEGCPSTIAFEDALTDAVAFVEDWVGQALREQEPQSSDPA